MRKSLLPLVLLAATACESDEPKVAVFPPVNLDSITALYDSVEVANNFPSPGDSGVVNIFVKQLGVSRAMADEVGCYYQPDGFYLYGNCSSYDHAMWAIRQATTYQGWKYCYGPNPRENNRWEFSCIA